MSYDYYRPDPRIQVIAEKLVPLITAAVTTEDVVDVFRTVPLKDRPWVFRMLDEKPGLFGAYKDRDDWTGKLRRVRNDKNNNLFDVLAGRDSEPSIGDFTTTEGGNA